MLIITWSKTNNIGITWELARHVDSRAPPRTIDSESAF